MNAPAASIIVNNCNYARYLREAIDSALDQTAASVEVIVVDDGSTDESRDIVAHYADRIIPVLKANGGQASTFNAGFAVSRGRMVLFLDADDRLRRDAVARTLPFFDDPAVVKVHWPLEVIDAMGRPTGARLPPRPLPEGAFRDVLIEQGPDSYLSVPTSGNAWSRAVLQQVLPVPESPYRQGADGYLLTVTPLFGAIRRIDDLLSSYRQHERNQFSSGTTLERLERSLSRYECRADSLQHFLAAAGIAHDRSVWKRRNEYYQWMCRLRGALRQLSEVTRAGEPFVLIDGNEWGDRVLPDRTALPYVERDGRYYGPPADGASAVDELERLRRRGARHVAIGWPAFWWLDHYTGLREHLTSTARQVLANDDLIVFALEP